MEQTDRLARANALFDAALDLARDQREAFLDRECSGDDALRALVGRLLENAESRPTGEHLATGGAFDAIPSFDRWLASEPDGRLLSDRYQLLRELGRGGMGIVYEARDERLDRAVAVKVLSVPAINEATRERFLREARAAAALSHPHVVTVFDAGEADGWPYLVMELVSGSGLDRTPPADLREALVIAARICDALEHAHARGIVHRDLKPGNVLRVPGTDGTSAGIKLTDLGIALTRGAPRMTRTGVIAGTPSYMAPEQALGQPLDGRADLYSLGVMLYEWTTGRLPFEGEDALAVVSQHIHAPVVPPRAYRPDLPPGVEPLILRLLSKAPEHRPPSAAAVREAVAAIGEGSAGVASPVSLTIEGLARGRMVGRRRELAELRNLWRAAGHGASRLALVSGEPGVGKTRLAHELTAAARLDGGLVLSGSCYENEATTPYLPFLEAFRRFARDCDDAALRTALGDTAPEIARFAPEIEARIGPLPLRPALSPQEERLRLFDNIARFLRRLADVRGLLFFIDDLQWADHGTLGLLHYVLRQLTDERLLFLGTYREVELGRGQALSKMLVDWNRERVAVRIRLDRLDLDETGKMVATLLGQEHVSEEFVTSLYADTDGNPFFVEEIVKALIAEGDLVHQDATWRRRRSGEFVLPQSVKAAIGSRLDRVSDGCGEMLRTAAVLGKHFQFSELATVAGGTEDELLDALDEAATAQLVAAGRGETFAFTHDKIREVLYDELNPIRRRRLHAKVAAGLEALHERGVVVAVEDLAYHFVESGEYGKGLTWARRAADAASRVFAWDEALAALTRARECAEALGRDAELSAIDEASGDAAWDQGDLVSAAAHFERALAGTGDADRRNALRAKVADVYATSGDRRGLDHVRRALAELDAGRQPRDTVLAMIVEARYLHLRGELDRAAERYLPAVRLAEQACDPELLTRALSSLAGTYQHMARFDDSDAAARRCIEIGEQENLPTAIMFGCEFQSENGYFRGFWDDSVRFGEREEALARETHAGERFLWSHFRAYSLAAMGRLAEAERLYRRGIAEAEPGGERRLELFLRMGLAGCLADRGHLADAGQRAKRAVEEADEAQLFSHRIVGRGQWVPILLRLGQLDDAVGEARTGISLWNQSGSRGTGLVNGPAFAEALVRGGAAPAEVLAVLDLHQSIAVETRAEHRRGQNLRVRAMLDLREGAPERALGFLDEAINTMEMCGSRVDLIWALVDRSRVSRRLGRHEGADADMQWARMLAEETGVAPELLDEPR